MNNNDGFTGGQVGSGCYLWTDTVYNVQRGYCLALSPQISQQELNSSTFDNQDFQVNKFWGSGGAATIDYKSKIIEKESVGLWKKSKKSINFDELTSLIVKPISSPKLRWELVIMCKEKGLQIYIGSKDILKIYASHLRPLLNLPIEIAQWTSYYRNF